MVGICYLSFFFFFKQKTAYEMRISDWSSDVCSSDLQFGRAVGVDQDVARLQIAMNDQIPVGVADRIADLPEQIEPRLQRQFVEIGRASCRERVCQYV